MNARTFAVSFVAAVLAVLTVVSAADAASAWVLWGSMLNSDVNHPSDSFDTKAQCEAEAERRRTSDQAVRDDMKRQLSSSDYRSFLISTHIFWKCLPDTVDPRGPKGSGR
jgi:hypothetical protein